MTNVTPLFRPFRLRGMELKNRIVMAPMTRSRSPGGFPNDDNVVHYARRAAGDVGLVLSEGPLRRVERVHKVQSDRHAVSEAQARSN